MSFLDIFAYTVVISRETVKSPKNTIFDTCAQNSWRYEFSNIFAHTVVISRKTVKSGKKTFYDVCAQNSRRYEFCDLFTHTVRISRKMVRSHRNSICDTCVQISRSYEFFDIFAYIVVVSSKTVKSASKIVFLGDLTVSRLITTVKAKMSRKLISPPVLVTNITNRVLSWFDRFVDTVVISRKNGQIS